MTDITDEVLREKAARKYSPDKIYRDMAAELLTARERIAELEKQLNEQLNDCINFDDGNLTESIMQRSSDLLRSSPPKD